MVCPKCKKDLQLEDFYVTAKRRSSYCKECSKVYMRERKYYKISRQKHRNEINEKNRERNKTPERKEYRRQLDQDIKFPYHKLMDEVGIKRVCAVCGSTSKLGTHHIDGNHDNNDLSNLQWLCSSCHNKLHDVDKIPKLTRDEFGRFIRKG